MGRQRPCDACKKRKSRCIRIDDSCDYCKRKNKQCTYTDRTTDANHGPMQIKVVPIELEKPLKIEDHGPTVIPKGYNSAMLAGPSSEQDPVLLGFYDKDADNITKFVSQGIHHVGVANTPVAFTVFCKEDASKISKYVEIHRAKTMQVALPYSERLLALYFKFIDWTYPAVDKSSFYQAFYFDKTKLHSGLFAGMLALSTIYWKYDSQLCVKPMPPNLAADLWELCRLTIEEEMSAPTLDTVQCLLMYVQKRLSRDNTSDLATLSVSIAKLVSCAFTLGLHLDSSKWNIEDREKLLRSRLWALVYTMDKWTAALLGRPSLLNKSQWTAPPFESHFHEEELFVQLYRLTTILDPILEDFYGARARYGNFDPTSPTTLALVEAHRTALEQWWTQLPRHLESMKPQPTDFCRNGILHLCALTIEVLLLRIQLHPKNMTSNNYPLHRNAARDTIQKIIRFTSEITHSHLHAFWLSSSSLAFSCIAHFVFYYFVQSPSDEREQSIDSIRKWLWALRVLTNAWQEGTGLATLRMDSVFYMGKTQVEIPQPQQPKHEQDYNSNNGTYEPSHPITGIFDEIDIGSEGLLNADILPADEQRQAFAKDEYHTDTNSQLFNSLTMADLVHDDLHDLLASTLDDL